MRDPRDSNASQSGAPARNAPIPVDLLVRGAGELCSPEGNSALAGSSLGRVTRLEGGAVAVHGERIVAVGPAEELETRYRAAEVLEAEGGLVVPGFVDAHTHPVFATTREAEFELRNQGRGYAEIAAAGGGILSTVRGVREASLEHLEAGLLARLDRFLEAGTTTLECKSGYGLERAAELRSLEAIAAANHSHAVDLVPTYLGAHTLPPEYADRREAYVEAIVQEWLPEISERRLARYADVFTESIAFGLDETRQIARAARALGLGVRLHVDQLTSGGGAELAAEVGAATADHLEHVSEAGLAALAEAGVQPVLCPLVPIYLREPAEAPGRRIVDTGLAPVLSTDFNPGSCMLQSLPEVVTFAALRYGFRAAESLTACTLNAAASLGLAEDRGSLEVGKRADLLVLDLPNLEHLAYEFGRNPVRAVVKSGRIVCQR